MAMQLKTITNKMLNQSTMTALRNYHSRITIPSIFWEDPFRRHRFRNKPDPFDIISPIQKSMAYRMPSMNNWGNERFTANPEEGFQVSLDVEHFAPNEINVKVVDKSIVVEAKHVKRAENGENYTSRHFTKRFVLPDGFDLTEIVSTLSSDGILTVSVPPKQIDPQNVRSTERNVNIQQTGTPARNPGLGSEQSRKPEMDNEPKGK